MSPNQPLEGSLSFERHPQRTGPVASRSDGKISKGKPTPGSLRKPEEGVDHSMVGAIPPDGDEAVRSRSNARFDMGRKIRRLTADDDDELSQSRLEALPKARENSLGLPSTSARINNY